MNILPTFLFSWLITLAIATSRNTSNGVKIFDYRSDSSLSRLVHIQTEVDKWYDVNQKRTREGVFSSADVIKGYWRLNNDGYHFLLDQTLAILNSMANRLETEVELLLSDPETVEDLMEMDMSQLIEFLKTKPKLLKAVLKNPKFTDIRKILKAHYTKLALLPLSLRLQALVFKRKWNST